MSFSPGFLSRPQDFFWKLQRCSVCPQMYDEVSGPGSRFKEKHSLDSDEEDEGEDGEKNSKYNILASDDIEGVFIHSFIACFD